MKLCLFIASLAVSLGCVAPALAISGSDASRATGGGALDQQPYLQCVPYARQLTGIQIRGDAHTWWDQAAGRYARGKLPKVGAVMNFRPYANSQLGHVAAVTQIIDSRTVLVSHANWSPIDGRRGQIERDVRVIDTSPENDWSTVRVWYGPNKAMGSTDWPLYGFIYNEKPGRVSLPASRMASADTRWASDPIGEIIAKRASRR